MYIWYFVLLLLLGRVQIMTQDADCVNIHLDGETYWGCWYKVRGRATLVFRRLCGRCVNRYRVWLVSYIFVLILCFLIQFLTLAVLKNNLDIYL